MNKNKLPSPPSAPPPLPRLFPLLLHLPGPAAKSRLILHRLPDAMRALLLFLSLFFSVSIFLSLSPYSSPHHQFFYGGLNFTTAAVVLVVPALPNLSFPSNHTLTNSTSAHTPPPPADHQILESDSILFPDWEVLVIVSSPSVSPGEKFRCVYPNKAVISPARFSGFLPSTGQPIFKCLLPERCRRKQEMKQPVLERLRSSSSNSSSLLSFSPPPRWLLRWTYLAYESFSTENDVVLLVKGVNNKQGFNRPVHELNCVFSKPNDDAAAAVTTTAVTSSEQEVFRCHHPELTALGPNVTGVKISLRFSDGKTIVPSVAYYKPWRTIADPKPKLQICAATMVYNAAKFLREWVIYHSGIGVEKFFLYDNDSDDDIQSVVGALNREGYRVETVPWIWPKSQEAGFSHSAVYARESCEWMMYIDVDEFVFAPRWSSAAQPSNQMLKSLIPSGSRRRVGQVTIRCNEFGPSGRESHPEEGVTQGYDCRRKLDNRHKSIVKLDAIEDSLLNAVHHFRLKRSGGGGGGGEYKWKKVKMETAVVNHYKYQAWSEFRAKFRRRVSAYVIDWKKEVNPASKDRAPGLGFRPEKPGDWERRFCEVRDRRLKWLAQKWFGGKKEGGMRMAWQR